MEIRDHAGGEPDALDELVRSLPEAVRTAADQPSTFWIRQRAAIRSRIAVEQASRRPLKALVLATGLALILLVLAVLKAPIPPPVPQAQADPDQELLLAVEQAVYSDVPEALAPAAMLAQEISQQKPHPDSKENPDAN